MFLSAYALQHMMLSVRNFCRRRRIQLAFPQRMHEVGVQGEMQQDPVAPVPPPAQPVVHQRRPVAGELVYIAPTAGTKVHRLNECRGLHGAIDVREYQLRRICYP